MKAIEILFPVFFMMLLGWLSRRRRWITTAQNEGAKSIVFSILLPLLVFQILMEAKLTTSFIYEILFLDVAWIVIYVLGKRIAKPVSGRYAQLAPFLLMTCEGGSVALPLYITLVGREHAMNIVTFDVAGILINFGLVPALVMRQTTKEVALFSLAKRIITAPFIIAVILGVVMNLSGIGHWLMESELHGVFTSTMSIATAPIASIILFTLGYDFQPHLSQIRPLIQLSLVRMIGCGAIVGGFFLLFPGLMEGKFFLIGVLLYFSCPPGFPVPLQVRSLCKSGDDEGFMSAFISLFIVLAMIAYTLITFVGIDHGV